MDDVQRLRAEVEALTARVKALTWASGVGAVVLAGLAGAALTRTAQAPDRVVAKEVAIVDDAGMVRARLGTTSLGAASLSLHEEGGKGRVWLETSSEHATLRFTDPGQRTLTRLSATPGLSGLHLAIAEGAKTAQLQASTETTSLMLADLDRSLVAMLRADPGATEVQLSRAPSDQPPRVASLSAGSANIEQGPALMLAGRQQFLEASVHPRDGEPRVVLAGQQRLSSSTAPEGATWIREDRPRPE